MVLGPDKKRLSKRHGAVSVEEFRDRGVLADALINYVALLGWSFDDHTNFMTREELIARFSLERITASPGVFDVEKLEWLNGEHLRALSPEAFAEAVLEHLDWRGSPLAARPDRVREAAPLVQEKLRVLDQFAGMCGFLFGPVEVDPSAWAKVAESPDAARSLAAARTQLAAVEGWQRRGRSRRALRAACESGGPEAAGAVCAGAGRDHRQHGFAGAVREPRAAGRERVARAARRRASHASREQDRTGRRRTSQGDPRSPPSHVHTISRSRVSLPRLSIAGLMLAFVLSATVATFVGVAAWSLGTSAGPSAGGDPRRRAYQQGVAAGRPQGRTAVEADRVRNHAYAKGRRIGFGWACARDCSAARAAGITVGRAEGYRSGYAAGAESGPAQGAAAGASPASTRSN